MTRRITAGIIAVIGAAAMMLGTTATAAVADTRNTSGTTNSIIDWSTGTNQYRQTHYGDDFGFDNNSGISIDMRWVKCTDFNVRGATFYDIRPSEGRQVIGTQFLAGTCLRSQYRGFTSTGSFAGVMHYNANFA